MKSYQDRALWELSQTETEPYGEPNWVWYISPNQFTGDDPFFKGTDTIFETEQEARSAAQYLAAMNKQDVVVKRGVKAVNDIGCEVFDGENDFTVEDGWGKFFRACENLDNELKKLTSLVEERQ